MANLHKLKQDICEIGRRIYTKGFAAANDGNITVRVAENEILCTPTLHCKGFLKPEDISLIDMTGKQLAGRRSDERGALAPGDLSPAAGHKECGALPSAPCLCVCDCPRADPQCILPEVEVFLGDVPITKYETPGGQAFADTIAPFVKKTNIILLANHGTVSYGNDVERAYWWTEILDAYCRMLLLSKQLGRVNFFTEEKERELLDLKTRNGAGPTRGTRRNTELQRVPRRTDRDKLEGRHQHRAKGISRAPADGAGGFRRQRPHGSGGMVQESDYRAG